MNCSFLAHQICSKKWLLSESQLVMKGVALSQAPQAAERFDESKLSELGRDALEAFRENLDRMRASFDKDIHSGELIDENLAFEGDHAREAVIQFKERMHNRMDRMEQVFIERLIRLDQAYRKADIQAKNQKSRDKLESKYQNRYDELNDIVLESLETLSDDFNAATKSAGGNGGDLERIDSLGELHQLRQFTLSELGDEERMRDLTQMVDELFEAGVTDPRKIEKSFRKHEPILNRIENGENLTSADYRGVIDRLMPLIQRKSDFSNEHLSRKGHAVIERTGQMTVLLRMSPKQRFELAQEMTKVLGKEEARQAILMLGHVDVLTQVQIQELFNSAGIQVLTQNEIKNIKKSIEMIKEFRKEYDRRMREDFGGSVINNKFNSKNLFAFAGLVAGATATVLPMALNIFNPDQWIPLATDPAFILASVVAGASTDALTGTGGVGTGIISSSISEHTSVEVEIDPTPGKKKEFVKFVGNNPAVVDYVLKNRNGEQLFSEIHELAEASDDPINYRFSFHDWVESKMSDRVSRLMKKDRSLSEEAANDLAEQQLNAESQIPELEGTQQEVEQSLAELYRNVRDLGIHNLTAIKKTITEAQTESQKAATS